MPTIAEAERQLDQFQAWLGKTRRHEVGRVATTGRRIDLGEVEGGAQVVYGPFLYQRRNTYDPSQPRVSSWTRQPTLAIVHRESSGSSVKPTEITQPIPYGRDLIELPGGLANVVLAHLDMRMRFVAAAS